MPAIAGAGSGGSTKPKKKPTPPTPNYHAAATAAVKSVSTAASTGAQVRSTLPKPAPKSQVEGPKSSGKEQNIRVGAKPGSAKVVKDKPKPNTYSSPSAGTKENVLIRNGVRSPKTGDKLSMSSGTAVKGFYGGKLGGKTMAPGSGRTSGGGGGGGGRQQVSAFTSSGIADKTGSRTGGGGGGGTRSYSGSGSRAAGGFGTGTKNTIGGGVDGGLVGSHGYITNFDGSTETFAPGEGTISGGGGGTANTAGRAVESIAKQIGDISQVEGQSVEDVVRGARKSRKVGRSRSL